MIGYPERARWSYLARSGLPAVSREKNFPESNVMNPLLTKLVRPRWLDIGLVLFCEFMDLDSVSVHKRAKKELGQYPTILTSHLVNNPYILYLTPSNRSLNAASSPRLYSPLGFQGKRCPGDDLGLHENVYFRKWSFNSIFIKLVIYISHSDWFPRETTFDIL